MFNVHYCFGSYGCEGCKRFECNIMDKCLKDSKFQYQKLRFENENQKIKNQKTLNDLVKNCPVGSDREKRAFFKKEYRIF